ncbi:AMP-binding protein [Piscinibacter gummiphilus]|uniref:AMP-binding protein n=1 Tax=Piscinibacter gummiphilus TaxID=946333 RepID=A0ABZ0CV18_9BURK|nr:AMP-binding protein [Piscinibacter gummiphilus]WOB08842.1 AMP-binding protein [Piscinibacter gummiphilus]
MTDLRELFSPTRLPGLSAHGRALLRHLREHPQAPRFRDFSGHRLGLAERWQARARHAWWQRRAAPDWLAGEPLPAWVGPFVARCAHGVDAHAGKAALPFAQLPTMDRHALATQLAAHVPRSLPLDELICFSTSGTTGHPLRVPSHPRVACDYYAHHRRALALFGIVPKAGVGDVGIVLAGFQQRCFTYVSVNPLQRECGLAKINLHPGEWRHPGDRAAYLDAMAPELISGDPVSLAELLRLGLRHRPRALLSTSMALSAGLRAELEAAFACPVLNLYSLNEVGPVAVEVPTLGGFVPLQPRLLIEVVDDAGRSLPPGERGEIVVTGGFNPWLPLLRYRTGDHASIVRTPQGLMLQGLEGRAPVRFRGADGRWHNNIEVTRAMAPFALVRFALHQRADASLVLRVDAHEPLPALAARLRAALAATFGDTPIEIAALRADDKVRQYTSALAGAETAR